MIYFVISLMFSIKSSGMVACGYMAKLFVERHFINNNWHRESFCVTGLCNVFDKVTIVVYKTF